MGITCQSIQTETSERYQMTINTYDNAMQQLSDLVIQIDRCEPTHNDGHEFKMNSAYIHAVAFCISAKLNGPKPIDMVLFCPACGVQHVDEPEQAVLKYGGSGASVITNPDRWTNPPHRSHLCASCGHIWRPADVPTNGVASIKTRGEKDSPK